MLFEPASRTARREISLILIYDFYSSGNQFQGQYTKIKDNSHLY